MKRKFIMPKLLRLARQECGSELVEFALTAMILLGLVFSVIGFALAMYTYHFVSSAAQQGMRFAIVRGYTWSKNTPVSCGTSAPPNFTMAYNCTASSADIQNYVQSLATVGIQASAVTVTTTWPGKTQSGATSTCTTANSQGCLVNVNVSYSYNWLLLERLSALTMKATSQGVVLQ